MATPKKNTLIFKDAEKARDAITAQQQKKIASLYQEWADDIGKKAEYYSHKSTSSAPLSERYYKELQKQLRETSKQVSNEVYKTIKQNVYTVADAVVKSNVDWLSGLGFPSDGLNGAFSSVPDSIVRKVVTGQIYDSGWSLSARIWSDNEDTLKDIYQIVAQGIAQNKPIYDIAKMLESYVSPGAKKPWNLTAPDGVKIYKKQVDYNAQRLARTLVQHGYQQSFIETTKDNPFITEYIWRSNGSRVCELCMSRDGKHYKKNELPMDHPNGMCTMEPAVDNDIVNKLADWVNSPDGTYPDIDNFASKFGYTPTKGFDKSKYANTAWYKAKSDFKGSWYKAQQHMDNMAKQNGYASPSAYWKAYTKGNVDDKTLDNILGMVGSSTKKSKPFNANEWLDALSKNDLNKFTSWCREWMKELTDDQIYAITKYTSNAYRDMNKYLRKISKTTDYAKEISDAKKALNRAKLPEDTVVRRGADANSLKGLFGVDDLEKVANNKDKYVGAVVQDRGFMSTSPDPRGGFTDDVEYIIKIPKGSNAMYVAPISEYENEKELLINAGTKYIVEKIETTKGGRINKVYLRVVVGKK